MATLLDKKGLCDKWLIGQELFLSLFKQKQLLRVRWLLAFIFVGSY